MNARLRTQILLGGLIILTIACNISRTSNPAASGGSATQAPELTSPPVEVPASTQPVSINHVLIPVSEAPKTALVYDTESSGTGPEKRAPYGDSYDKDLLERAFLQDMTYVPDLDINTFGLGLDDTWYYVTINLIGSDPNNTMGIDYGVEIDTNSDGFGDYLILAQPPYKAEWDAVNIKVYEDKNHDTSGRSADKSDAPISTDGYETLVLDGSTGTGDDLDLAWDRMASESNATVQFAFKKSLAGTAFMFGVLADGGLKDPSKFDYVDRFTEAEAGSPVRDKQYYPLGALYSVDNTCRQAFGFTPNGYEPMLCPSSSSKGGGGNNNGNPTGCQPPPGGCDPTAPNWWPAPHCACSITPYHP